MRVLITGAGLIGTHTAKELIERGILNEEGAARIEEAAGQEIEAAAQFAIDSPYPPLEAMYTDVFA